MAQFNPANHFGLDQESYSEIEHALRALDPGFSMHRFVEDRPEFHQKVKAKPVVIEATPVAPVKTKVARVYDYIAECQPASARAIRNATGLDHREISSVLNKLCRRGQLAKQPIPDGNGRMVYLIVPEKPYLSAEKFQSCNGTTEDGD